MLEKKLSPTFIIIISLIISISGILNNMLFSTQNSSVVTYRFLTDPLNLGWAFIESLSLRTNGINYVNSVFDCLLLLGVVMFTASKNVNAALIRFVFSIIFCSNVLALAVSIFFKLFVSHRLPLIDLGYYFTNFVWIYLAYLIIHTLSQNKIFEHTIADGDGAPRILFYKATNWQRFLHAFMDSIVTIMLFSPMITLYFLLHNNGFFRNTPGTSIMPLFIPLRIIYYLFFETIFGATPAKYLTCTRVVDYYGNKPNFKTIAIRTSSRLVPFEAFSFFVDDGWHDKWSLTVVTRETNIILQDREATSNDNFTGKKVSASLYIENIEVGKVDLKVIDYSMGALGGDLIPNTGYGQFKNNIQESCELNGMANVINFDLKLVLSDNSVLTPEGGIGITDVKSYNEIYVETVGNDLTTINFIGSE